MQPETRGVLQVFDCITATHQCGRISNLPQQQTRSLIYRLNHTRHAIEQSFDVRTAGLGGLGQ